MIVRLIVLLKRHAYAFTLEEKPQRLGIFETIDNSNALASLSLTACTPILALPGRTAGQIQIIHLVSQKESSNPISILVAHSSPIACLELSRSGQFLASASEKGTLIRVWHVPTSKLVNELRRGTDRAAIHSIAFSNDETRLVVSSDKGTIHIFNLVASEDMPHAAHEDYGVSRSFGRASSSLSLNSTGNRQSILSSFSSYLPKYFSSEWSFASFSLPVESKCIVSFTRSDIAIRYKNDALLGPAFANDESGILALCADGSVYKFRFDPKKGGDCVMESFHVFWRKSGPNSLGGIQEEDGSMPDDFWDDWEEDPIL